MADDWEDWEAEDFKPPAPAAPAPAKAAAPGAKPAPEYETAGAAILAKATDLDMSKFADEDAGEEEKPAWMAKAAADAARPPPAKKEEKWKGKGVGAGDVPLDDPVAERLRRQRLVEEADYAAARELFGGDGKQLDSFLPKTIKDCEEYAGLLFGRRARPPPLLSSPPPPPPAPRSLAPPAAPRARALSLPLLPLR